MRVSRIVLLLVALLAGGLAAFLALGNAFDRAPPQAPAVQVAQVPHDQVLIAKANIGRPIVRLMSVMEHLPGIRQSRDMDSYFHRAVKATGESLEVVRRRVERMITEKTHVGALVRPQVVALAKAHGLPLLSHDDTDIEHIDLAADEGVTISEFPCTLEAALEARRRGMLTIGAFPITLPLRITSMTLASVLNWLRKSKPERGGIDLSGDCGFGTPPSPLGPWQLMHP